MSDSNQKSFFLNAAIIVSTAVLVALIIYSNSFHKNLEPPTAAAQASSGITSKNSNITRKIVAENHKTYQKTKNFVSPLADVVNPPRPQETPQNISLGGDLANKSEFEKALKRQTEELQYELYSQDPHPNNKRALAITKEEIKELEKSKRIIY